MIAYYSGGWLQFLKKEILSAAFAICSIIADRHGKCKREKIMNSLYFRAFRLETVLDKSLKIWQNRDIICKGHCASRMIEWIKFAGAGGIDIYERSKMVVCCFMLRHGLYF